MKTQMQQKLEAVLNKTNVTFRKDNAPAPNATHKGKHALHKYKGVVEYPITLGGGIVWLKSSHAVRNYEVKGWKVVWL